MSAPTTPAGVRPADRYGDRPGRRWVRWAASGVIALALVAWSLWYTVHQAGSVTATTQAYSVRSDSVVQVTFSVTKPAGATARCEVQALSSGSARVGLAVVRIGPQRSASVARTVTVRTQQRAVTGEVLDCTRT